MKFILGKYIKHFTKETIKALKIILIALAIIVGVIALKYKPVYEVTISGKTIGYVKEKDRLEKKINNFLNNTEGCIAFIEATVKPEYKYVLVSKNTETVEQQVLATVKDTSITTYKTYAISVDGENKAQVDSQNVAEDIIQKIKEGVNEEIKLDLAITEVYNTNFEVVSSEEALSTLNTIKNAKIENYEKAKAEEAKKLEEEKAKAAKAVNTSSNVSYDFNPITIAFIQPVNGTISSRFGVRSSIRSSVHTGLDIASPKGTPIQVAAQGTVTYAGYKGAYGNLIVVSHGNGVETYYAHCNEIKVVSGQKVNQGDVIGLVGSTGNSTGPHLHLEIRVNGVAQNPQNYLY